MDRESLWMQGGTEQGRASLLPWVIAAVVVVLVGVVVVLAGHAKAGLPDHSEKREGYGEKLVVSGVKMSESTSLSGGKSTYIDGLVKNVGDATVTGATAKVAFANEELMPAQMVAQPLMLIRTHEPYVDTVGLGDAPLKPGVEREFRLVFENVAPNWNQQLPVIQMDGVSVACNPCVGGGK